VSTARVQLLTVTEPLVLVIAKGADGVTFAIRIETPRDVYESATSKSALLDLAAQITGVANS
jgi:hypothetical protein